MRKSISKYFLLAFLCVRFVNMTDAQKYHQMMNKNEWAFQCGNFGSIWLDFFKTDTAKVLIDGKHYTKVVRIPYDIVGYCREDTVFKKIWVKYTVQDTEKVLYDFSLKVGDTLTIPHSFFGGSGNKIIVTKIDSINTTLGWLVRQKYNDNTVITEAIGSLSAFAPIYIKPTASDPSCGLWSCYSNDKCVYSISGCLASMLPCSLTVKVLPPDFCGDCGGKAIALMSGAGVTYTWSPFSTVQTANIKTNLCTGTYTVIASDPINNCTQYSNITILPKPYVSTKHVNASCFTCGDGKASVLSFGQKPLSYSWSTNPVQTNDTAVGLSRGKYFICVTDTFGCQACDSVFIDSPLNTWNNNVDNSWFKVYPNPATSNITIEANINKLYTIQIINLLGETVYGTQQLQGNNINIDVGVLPKGIYIVQLSDKNSSTRGRQRFVLQ